MNSRKIGCYAIERQPHSHFLQSLIELLAIGRFELWDNYLSGPSSKLTCPLRPMRFIERADKIVQSRHLARDKYVHRIALIAIGDANGLEVLILEVRVISRLIHHCGLPRIAAQKMKRPWPRLCFFELR